MAKIAKEEFKSIVKECLIEILSEGLLHGEKNKKIEKNHLRQKRKKVNTIKERRKKVKKDINTNLTNDPILNEMLQDTAENTLMEQVAADSKNNIVKMQGDNAAKLVDNASPEELFGEVSNNWAALAFS